MGRLTLKCIVEDIEVMAEGLTEKVQEAKGESNRTFKWRNILKYDVNGILTYLNKDEKDSKHDWILIATTLYAKAVDKIHGYNADYVIIPRNLLTDREVQFTVAICQAPKIKYKIDI